MYTRTFPLYVRTGYFMLGGSDFLIFLAAAAAAAAAPAVEIGFCYVNE